MHRGVVKSMALSVAKSNEKNDSSIVVLDVCFVVGLDIGFDVDVDDR